MPRRPRLPFAVAASGVVTLTVAAALAPPARSAPAFIPGPTTTRPPATTTTAPTTTTTEEPAPTTTTTDGGLLPTAPTGGGGSSTTSTTGAPGGPANTRPAGGATPPAGEGDGGRPKGSQIPPDAQAQINAVRRSGPNNTTALVAAVAQLAQPPLNLTPEEVVRYGYGQFPIGGTASFVDDWLFPRFVPSFHLHQGTDIFAAFGTPVRAPFAGALKLTNGAVGGLAAYVTLPDGTYVYMAHLQSFAAGVVDGQQVAQGQVVGYVGDSGNARGGAPHCHFEIHPAGGTAIDPKATLDLWLRNALLDLPRVTALLRQAKGIDTVASITAPPSLAAPAPYVTAAAPTRPIDRVADGGAGTLWAAASNPTVGTLHVAAALVSRAADKVEWGDGTGAPRDGAG